MTKKPSLANQSGQMIVESILMITFLFGMTFMVANYFKDEEVLRQLVTGPWVHIAGMLQNGVWAPAAAGAMAHPNSHGRHIVITGEEAK